MVCSGNKAKMENKKNDTLGGEKERGEGGESFVYYPDLNWGPLGLRRSRRSLSSDKSFAIHGLRDPPATNSCTEHAATPLTRSSLLLG